MSNVGEKMGCPTCHELVQIMKLNPDKEREGWYIERGKIVSRWLSFLFLVLLQTYLLSQ
jgi:hypothetical protein